MESDDAHDRRAEHGNPATPAAGTVRGPEPVRIIEVAGPEAAPGPGDLQRQRRTAVNPFVTGLWVLGAALVVLPLLLIFAATYADIGRGNYPGTTIEGMPWLAMFQPFAVQTFAVGLATISAAMVLEAIRWARGHPDHPRPSR